MGFSKAKEFNSDEVQHINYSFFMDYTFGAKSKNSLPSTKYEDFLIFLSYTVLCFVFKSANSECVNFCIKVVGLAQCSFLSYGCSIVPVHT